MLIGIGEYSYRDTIEIHRGTITKKLWERMADVVVLSFFIFFIPFVRFYAFSVF